MQQRGLIHAANSRSFIIVLFSMNSRNHTRGSERLCTDQMMAVSRCQSAVAGLGKQFCSAVTLLNHLMQTQRVYLACALISFICNCFLRRRLASKIGTVINFVAVRASRFNKLQPPSIGVAIESKRLARWCAGWSKSSARQARQEITSTEKAMAVATGAGQL